MTSTPVLAGFAELYERHHEAVFRAALRVTGNPADAEDVLQTVFLRVLARGGDVEAAQPPACGSCRVGLRRSGAACRRPAPFAAERTAPTRHRHTRKRGRNTLPSASR